MRPIGILLIVVGLIGVTWGGFTYVKSRHTSHLGPIHVTTKTRDHVSIPPTAGVAALVAGGLLMVFARRGVRV